MKDLTPRAKKLLLIADVICAEWKHSYIGVEHILAAMLRIDGPCGTFMTAKEIKEEHIKCHCGIIKRDIPDQEKVKLIKQKIAELEGYVKDL